MEEKDLPAILAVNEVFFCKTRNPDLEWALHLPMRLCSPMLLLARPSNRDPTDNALDQQAKSLFSFNTTIAVTKPASKKRKLEEDATSAEDCAGGEEVLAQVPLPLPEPEEIVVPRLTRGKRVDRA